MGDYVVKQEVYDRLDAMGIEYEVTCHAPVYTMEDMEREGLEQLGVLCKNLFLRDAKGKRHFLVTAREDTRIDLMRLGAALGAGKLSFAGPERLSRYLGVTAGCVSPFGVFNDEGHEVEVVFDSRLLGEKRLGVHPNENDATVWISFDDLEKAVSAAGNRVSKLDLGAGGE